MTGPGSFASPTDLMRAAGVTPASPALACALDASYARRPTADQRALWPSLSRMPWPTRRLRRLLAAWGRRGFKTSGFVSWSCVYELLMGGHEEHAAPGSRVYFVVICPVVAQAREAVRGIMGALDAVAPLGVRYEVRDLAGAPELVIRSPASRVERVVKVFTADAVAVRGFAVAFVALDEAGFLPSAEWHAQTGEDILRAVTPATAQFPRARILLTSSPGAPEGVFHRLVTAPPTDALLMTASTWTLNPRITEAMCRELAGDEAVFAQEYAASRFGFHNETFIEAASITLGSAHAGLGPRPGSFVIGLDVAQLHDQTAIVVASGFDLEVSPQHAPVRHVVCERIEVIESSRENPTSIESIAARVAATSKAYGDAPILHDAFLGPVVKQALRTHGLREHDDPTGTRVPPRGTFAQRSMAPASQTPRWRFVRELAHGGRLHLGEEHGVLARQLAQLHATQLSNGSLKVEGRRDDVADAFALAAEVAAKLPATGGPAGRVEFRGDGVRFDHETRSVHVRRGRWVSIGPDGRETLAEVPRWHPSFADYARDAIAAGWTTKAIEAWQREQRGE